MADNRSFLAASTGPKTLDRSFDLFVFFRLDLNPFAIALNCVCHDTQSGDVYPVWDDSVLLLSRLGDAVRAAHNRILISVQATEDVTTKLRDWERSELIVCSTSYI